MVVLTDASPWKQAIALRNQRMSPLLKLPGEIRNRIYGYVLGHPVWYVGNSHEKRDAEGNVYEIFRLYEETQPGRHKPRASFGPSLLGVSRQIHLEAWPLFYSSSTFVVGNPRLFFFWIESLPEVARLAVASVSLGQLDFHGRVNDASVDLDVSDALYPRTSFPPLDTHQIRQAPTLASSWEYNVLTSLGDVYWRLPGLKHLHLTVKVTYGEFQGFHAPYRRVEDQDIEAKVRSTVANVFALPNVHVDSEVSLFKRYGDEKRLNCSTRARSRSSGNSGKATLYISPVEHTMKYTCRMLTYSSLASLRPKRAL